MSVGYGSRQRGVYIDRKVDAWYVGRLVFCATIATSTNSDADRAPNTF